MDELLFSLQALGRLCGLWNHTVVRYFVVPQTKHGHPRSLSGKSRLPLGQLMGAVAETPTEHGLRVPGCEPSCLALSADGVEKHGFQC